MKTELNFGGAAVQPCDRLDEPRPDERSAFCLSRLVSGGRRTAATAAAELRRQRLQSAYELRQRTTRQLIACVQTNDLAQLKRLLEEKPDLNVMVNGQTVLHYCLLFGEQPSPGFRLA